MRAMLLYSPEAKQEEIPTVMQTHCNRVLSYDVSIEEDVMKASWDGQVRLGNHEDISAMMQTHCDRVLSCDVSIEEDVMKASWDGQVWLLQNIGLQTGVSKFLVNQSAGQVLRKSYQPDCKLTSLAFQSQ